MDNNPNNVVAAFEMLLEEVEAEIDFTSAAGARAFEKRDLDAAREALEYVGKVTAFRDRVAALRDEWEAGYAAPPEEEEQRQRERREYLGRLQRGVRTPERAYFKPILQVLVDMGGRGTVADVLARVEKVMKPLLKDIDYEPLAPNHNAKRWYNSGQWARNTMARDGRIRGDSPKGVWEISDKGRQWLLSQTSAGR